MSETFNPYYQRLGIPIAFQPADHYRLLGIERFESDTDVIVSAAEQRGRHLKSLQTTENYLLIQRLRNEILQACTCLLNSGQKTEYDNQLRLQKQNSLRVPLTSSPEPNEDARNATPASLQKEKKSSPQFITEPPISSVNNTNKCPASPSDFIEPGDFFPTPTPPPLPEQLSRSSLSGDPEPPPLPQMSLKQKHRPPSFPEESSTPEPGIPIPPPLPNEQWSRVDRDSVVGYPPQISINGLDTAEGAPTFPSAVDQMRTDDDPFSTENKVSGSDIFSPIQEKDVDENQRRPRKSDRKKQMKIRIIGHVLAPLIGLILGWIILQYLKK